MRVCKGAEKIRLTTVVSSVTLVLVNGATSHGHPHDAVNIYHRKEASYDAMRDVWHVVAHGFLK